VTHLGWYCERILRERRCARGRHISACKPHFIDSSSTIISLLDIVQPDIATCAASCTGWCHTVVHMQEIARCRCLQPLTRADPEIPCSLLQACEQGKGARLCPSTNKL